MNNTDKNAWLESFRQPAMAKIHECEAFLAQYGVMPQAGIEQKFWVTPENPAEFSMQQKIDRGLNAEFVHSPSVEQVYTDDIGSPHKAQIVVGRGNGSNMHNYPDTHMLPSAVVATTESARNLLLDKIKNTKHGIQRIRFQSQPMRGGLHINMSLFFGNTPLFNGYNSEIQPEFIESPNRLTSYCIEGALEAQANLIALLTGNPIVFERFQDRSHFLGPKTIGMGRRKKDGGSLLLRTEQDEEMDEICPCYIDRLNAANTPAYLSTMVTLVGITEGFKQYLRDNHITTPEAFREHVESTDFNTTIALPTTKRHLAGTQEEAIKLTEESGFAQNVLGAEFLALFCQTYRQHMQRGRAGR